MGQTLATHAKPAQCARRRPMEAVRKACHPRLPSQEDHADYLLGANAEDEVQIHHARSHGRLHIFRFVGPHGDVPRVMYTLSLIHI